MERYTCYLPSNLDVDTLLAECPPTGIERFSRDKLIYVSGLVNSITASNKDLETPNGFVPVHAHTLQNNIRNYNQYLDYTLNTGIYQTDSTWVKGEKSTGYKYTDKFNTTVKPVFIQDADFVKNLKKITIKPKALERVAQIKGIKVEKANFSFLCRDLSQLSDFTKPINNEIYKLMKRTLPGPFTYILNASNNVPRIFQSKKKTIGIRIPDNNIVSEIIHELGNPITSTSIHDEDEIIEYTTDPELIYEKFQKHVDIVIDAGFGDNEPSTIIDCTGHEALVVREGKGKL